MDKLEWYQEGELQLFEHCQVGSSVGFVVESSGEDFEIYGEILKLDMINHEVILVVEGKQTILSMYNLVAILNPKSPDENLKESSFHHFQKVEFVEQPNIHSSDHHFVPGHILGKTGKKLIIERDDYYMTGEVSECRPIILVKIHEVIKR